MLCLRGFGLVLAGQIPGMELLPEDQYLCTGLDLYLTEEPGMVSAMALVHSRIRKVFFKSRNIFHGALGSKYMLHTSKALNHRFRVFECVANDAQWISCEVIRNHVREKKKREKRSKCFSFHSFSTCKTLSKGLILALFEIVKALSKVKETTLPRY